MPCSLLLIGWEIEDWNFVSRQLLQAGLPNLQQLLRRGSTGTFSRSDLLDQSTSWTTLFTGKQPANHRILSDWEPGEILDDFQKVTRSSRQALALWEIAGRDDRSVHSINFPATYPAGPIARGSIISDYFFHGQGADSVYPRELLPELLPMVVTSQEINDAMIAELRGEPSNIPQQALAEFKSFVANAATTQALATRSLEQEASDIVAVRFSRIQNPPQDGRVDFASAKFLDLCLGRLIELAGAEANIVFAITPSQKSNGVISFAGPSFKTSHPIGQCGLQDILPTILATLQIPSRANFDGRVIISAFQILPEVKTGASGEPRGVKVSEPTGDDTSVAHLLALGYRDVPDRYAELAIARWNNDQAYRLALAHMEAGDFDRALPLLERLVQARPRSILFRSKLAEVCFHLHDLDRSKSIIEALIGDGVDTPLARAGLAAIALGQHDYRSALSQLDAALKLNGASADVLEIMGRLYLRLRKLAPARELFARVLQVNPEHPAAHDGLGLADLLHGNVEEAEEHFHRAVSLFSLSSQSHQHLATALLKQGKLAEALASLRTAEAISPMDPGIHRRLASVLEKMGDHSAAVQHRWLAREHADFKRRRSGSFDTTPRDQF